MSSMKIDAAFFERLTRGPVVDFAPEPESRPEQAIPPDPNRNWVTLVWPHMKSRLAVVQIVQPPRGYVEFHTLESVGVLIDCLMSDGYTVTIVASPKPEGINAEGGEEGRAGPTNLRRRKAGQDHHRANQGKGGGH